MVKKGIREVANWKEEGIPSITALPSQWGKEAFCGDPLAPPMEELIEDGFSYAGGGGVLGQHGGEVDS